MITRVGYDLRTGKSLLKKADFAVSNFSKNSSKLVSFKSTNIKEIPKDWGIYKDVISNPGRITEITDSSDKYIQSVSNPIREANPEDIKNYTKEHPGSGLIFCNITSRFHTNCYEGSAPTEFVFQDDGVIYTEKDGSVTYYDNSEISDFVNKHKHHNSPDYKYSKDERILLGLMQDKRYKEFRHYLNTNKVDIANSSDVMQRLVIDYYISIGLKEKALKLCPERVKYIDEMEERAKSGHKPTVNDFLAKGDFRGALSLGKKNMPEPFNKLPDSKLNDLIEYLEDRSKLFKYEEYLKNTIDNTPFGPLDECTDNERVQIDMVTLGLAEVGNFAIKKIKKIYSILDVQKKIYEIETLMTKADAVMEEAAAQEPW